MFGHSNNQNRTYTTAPTSEISSALAFINHYATTADKRSFNQLISMLQNRPSLLLEAGDVVDSHAKKKIKKITIYQYFLLKNLQTQAELIATHFEQLTNGTGEKERQDWEFLDRNKKDKPGIGMRILMSGGCGPL